MRVARDRAKVGSPPLTNPKMFPTTAQIYLKVLPTEKKFHRHLPFLSQGPDLIAPPLSESSPALAPVNCN